MSIYLGDFPVSATIYVPFNTFSSVGASVTITGLAVTDIEIYKDGSATQRASDAGYTLLDTDGIDFDGITGIHGFSIDTNDNTDAGFYAAGHEYWIVVASITCDSQTLNFVAATFSIERAGGALALLKNATYGLSALEALVDDLESRLTAARAGYLDNLQYLPAVAAGAAGGLPILGANAAGASFAGQIKIAANVANEGALDIRNANALGHGTLNDGGNVGLYNSGASMGQYNFGTADYGIYAAGAVAGQYNLGNGGTGYGQYNAGDAIGQYNAGSGAGSAGQTNQGVAQGQHNSGATGQQNDGGAVGQFNTGTTYGAQNTGASGLVNVGTAGDGIYASGTDRGFDVSGTAGAFSDAAVEDIADQVWDELIAGHLGIGSTGAALNGATAPTAAAVADAVWDEALAGHLAAGSTGNALNSAGGAATVFPTGAINFTYTVTDSATLLPLEGVEVWISTDSPAVNVVWKGDTDAFGVARDVLGNLPALDAGTYYFWRQLAGYTFSDPDTEVVS